MAHHLLPCISVCHSSCPCQSCSPKQACAAAVVSRSARQRALLTLPWWPRSRCLRARDEIGGRGGQVLVCLRARYPPLAAKSPPGLRLGLVLSWAITHGTYFLRSPSCREGCCQGHSPRLPVSRAKGTERHKGRAAGNADGRCPLRCLRQLKASLTQEQPQQFRSFSHIELLCLTEIAHLPFHFLLLLKMARTGNKRDRTCDILQPLPSQLLSPPAEEPSPDQKGSSEP